MVVARREEGKRDVIEHLLLFSDDARLTSCRHNPESYSHREEQRKRTWTKKNNVVFSEEPARSMTGEGYIKQRYVIVPVKPLLVIVVNFCCVKPVHAARKKRRKTKTK